MLDKLIDLSREFVASYAKSKEEKRKDLLGLLRKIAGTLKQASDELKDGKVESGTHQALGTYFQSIYEVFKRKLGRDRALELQAEMAIVWNRIPALGGDPIDEAEQELLIHDLDKLSGEFNALADMIVQP